MPLAATVASHGNEGIVEGIHEMGLRGVVAGKRSVAPM